MCIQLIVAYVHLKHGNGNYENSNTDVKGLSSNAVGSFIKITVFAFICHKESDMDF
jgi:hypothetical protein